jgi:hypothetical protein
MAWIFLGDCDSGAWLARGAGAGMVEEVTVGNHRIVRLAGSIDPLKDYFNSNSQALRFLALLSPT